MSQRRGKPLTLHGHMTVSVEMMPYPDLYPFSGLQIEMHLNIIECMIFQSFFHIFKFTPAYKNCVGFEVFSAMVMMS
jgi:hypothetical protein